MAKMKTTLNEIKSLVEAKYGVLEVGNFYNISDIKLKIETKDGFKPVKSFVVKTGMTTIVTFDNDTAITCSSAHIFMSPSGKVFARDIAIGTEIETASGVTKVTNVLTSDEAEFYDLEVDSAEHTYLTANGINHHNTGKTQTVEDTLAAMGKTDGDGFFKISGSISPSGLYRVLFEHRNELILSDDCDDLFKDQEGRNLLKAACDTKKVRKISWMKSGSKYIDPDDYDYDNPGDELPKYFDFKGKLIAISNLKLDKLDPDGAFRTRCYIIDINPTNEELYEWMKKIAPNVKLDVQYELSLDQKLKCIDILKTRNLGGKLTSLRSFVRAVNTMAGVLQQGGSE